METRTDRLVIRLETDGDGQVRAAMLDTEQGVEQVGARVEAANRSFLSMERIVAGLSVGALTALTVRTLDTAATINDFSTRIGASRAALSEYAYVAEQTGVQFEALAIAWQRQARRVGAAADGYGAAKDTLRALGIEARSFNDLAPEDQFEILAERLMEVENQGTRMAYAMSLWDTGGVQLLQTIEGGTEALREMREEARRSGRAMGEDQVQAMAAAAQAVTNLRNAGQGLTNALVVELAPGVQSLAERLTVLTHGMAQYGDAVKLAGVATVALVGARTVGPVLASVGAQALAMSRSMTAATASATALRGALALVGGPAGAALLAGGALLYFATSARSARAETGQFTNDLDMLLGRMDAVEERQIMAGIEERTERIRDLQREILGINQEITNLQLRFGRDQPMTAALREQVAMLQDQLDGGRRELDLLEARLEEVRNRGSADPPAAAGASEELLAYAAQEEEALRRSFAALNQHLLTQEERIATSYDQRRMMIENAYAMGTIPTEERYTELLERTEAERQARLLAVLGDGLAQYAAAQEEARRAAFGRFNDELASDEERAQFQYQARLMQLEDYYTSGLIPTEERYKELLERIEEEHQERLLSIQQEGMSAQHRLWVAGWQGKLQVASGILGQLSALMFAENRKMFEVGRAAAVSQAVIDTIAGAQKSFSALAGIPIVGPALGAAAAAAAYAAGYVRVQAIRNTQFGQAGGGAVGTYTADPVSGTPATAAAGGELPGDDRGAPGRSVTVTLAGDVYGWDDYVQSRVIEGIREAVGEHDEVIITRGSRQAAELAA